MDNHNFDYNYYDVKKRCLKNVTGTDKKQKVDERIYKYAKVMRNSHPIEKKDYSISFARFWVLMLVACGHIFEWIGFSLEKS